MFLINVLWLQFSFNKFTQNHLTFNQVKTRDWSRACALSLLYQWMSVSFLFSRLQYTCCVFKDANSALQSTYSWGWSLTGTNVKSLLYNFLRSVTPAPSTLYLVNTLCLAKWRGDDEGGETQTRGRESHKLWFENMQEFVCVHIGFNLKCNSL